MAHLPAIEEPLLQTTTSGVVTSLSSKSADASEPFAPSMTLSPSIMQDPRQKLLNKLYGQRVRVPDLSPLFAHWPSHTNGTIDLLREDVRQWLDETVTHSRVQGALQASDFGLFGATWWPRAAFDRLRICTYLAVWLFIWDDEIDLSDGAMWDRYDAAESYRGQTIAYVRYSLGIDAVQPVVTNRVILNFEVIGAALRASYSLEKRNLFLNEMSYFVQMSSTEQSLRLSGAIPTLDTFWQYRLGSSAVSVCLALSEFAGHESDLPISFYHDVHVQALFRHTNILISAVNDLLSVKKEFQRDAIDSLIPILYAHLGSVEGTVEQIVMFIEDEVAKMDAVAASIEMTYAGQEPEVRRMVVDFIYGCKCLVTGNLAWSLQTERYGVKEHLNEKTGEIVMLLGKP